MAKEVNDVMKTIRTDPNKEDDPGRNVMTALLECKTVSQHWKIKEPIASGNSKPNVYKGTSAALYNETEARRLVQTLNSYFKPYEKAADDAKRLASIIGNIEQRFDTFQSIFGIENPLNINQIEISILHHK